MDKKKQQKLVDLLKELEPGFLPFEIFVQIARIVTLSIVEFVPLRKNNNSDIEVLLLSREKDDMFWSGEIHTPGTVIRPTDNEENKYLAFERIVNEELKAVKVSKPYFVGSLLHKSKRGTEHSQVYWIEVLEEPKVGKFYSVNKLPSNLIESQRKFIQQAVNSFTRYKAL